MHSKDAIHDLLRRRDLANFLSTRTARPGDDLMVGELLVRSFRETYARKLPTMFTPASRELELRDVARRRHNGIVRIVELGFEIIGTYSLIAPGTALDESWTPNSCYLRCLAIDPRFHSLKLSDRLISDAIEMAKRWSASSVCLHVQAEAPGVGRLYEGFGFTRSAAGDRLNYGTQIEGYALTLGPSGDILTSA